MRYYSTNNSALRVSLREAVLKGLPDDGGLYMPEHIERLPPKLLDGLAGLSLQEIALEVSRPFVADAISETELSTLVTTALNFDAPLVELQAGPQAIYALELFHGPTLAFKDFGARFMARLLMTLLQGEARTATVLVATSGDTGAAVAAGFFGLPGVRVVILYPGGGVSKMQEQQLTTWGANVSALEIQGTFDDCQRLVKQAFLDRRLNERLLLSSANSINVARLIPQSIYYFYALAQLLRGSPSGRADLAAHAPIFSVPSGNFGNLTAGILAQRMGLPVRRFIAATNINDVVPEYLERGVFAPRPSQRTISNAMDVGNPSNFVRLVELYAAEPDRLREDLVGYRFTDAETRAGMADIRRTFGYTADPHGAVAYLGLSAYLRERLNSSAGRDTAPGIFLETAHPAKFAETVQTATGEEPQMPPRLAAFLDKKKVALALRPRFEDLADFLAALPQ